MDLVHGLDIDRVSLPRGRAGLMDFAEDTLGVYYNDVLQGWTDLELSVGYQQKLHDDRGVIVTQEYDDDPVFVDVGIDHNRRLLLVIAARHV